MALISLLLACRDAPPGPRPDLCPGLDWVVHLSTAFCDEVTDVVALPGGDVLVAGRHGGAARIGTGEDDVLPPVVTLYNPFVARLGFFQVVDQQMGNQIHRDARECRRQQVERNRDFVCKEAVVKQRRRCLDLSCQRLQQVEVGAGESQKD